jgi:hypothetical protein
MADKGYGQLDPSDTSSGYNRDSFIIKQLLSLMSTAKPVVVKAVDTGAKTVDVQPLVKQLDGQGNATSHGVINAVPYLRLQSGKNAVIIDPVVGDKGLMVCCERDISSVFNTKGEANPGSYRKYDHADGVYITGLAGMNDDPEQWVKFTNTGIEIADKNNNKLVSSSSGWQFTGPVMFNDIVTAKNTLVAQGSFQLSGSFLGAGGGVYAGAIRTTLTITGDTDVVGAGHSLKTHTHLYTAPAGGGPQQLTSQPQP